MSDRLKFDPDKYQVMTCSMDGRSVTYRAFQGLDYCEAPLDPIQKMNLFVPEVYYQGQRLNGYDLASAPVFMPNTVGGYMPGPADEPGKDRYGHPNSIFQALEHGYVVASAGVRGRTSGRKSVEFFEGGKADLSAADASGAGSDSGPDFPDSGANSGKMTGRAPALIVDMKAAIRYLRHNAGRIPGDVEKIVTNGTSAGGALSALAGASGNAADYEPYLRAIKAADERDDIFAASCYCPIHNLEHADMAYEWQFHGERTFHMMKREKTKDGLKKIPFTGELSEEQMELSAELKKLFPDWLNSLKLTDENERPLTLNPDGTGSFQEEVIRYLIRSARKELETGTSAGRLGWLAVPGSAVHKQTCLTIRQGQVEALDWDEFIRTITRMKPTPAFDDLSLNSPENEEFGTETIEGRHFTAFSKAHSKVGGAMAEEHIIKMMNPICQIGKADVARHWRIRHGAFDRDTSLAIPVILALLLKNKGYDVDFQLPWGLPHSGDYDLQELFDWIDSRVRGERL